MVATAVAVEAGGCFEGVDHEAVAGTGGEEGVLLGAGATGWDVGHLGSTSVTLMIVKVNAGFIPAPICWVVVV